MYLGTQFAARTDADYETFKQLGVNNINGFPDVPVYSFLVMPHNKDIMWAGTEVGLIESTDGGTSWHLVESNLPYVTIWDLKLKDEDKLL